MNYIILINNFWKADTEYSFTGNETKLYMYLLHTSNSLGWKNPFRLSYRQTGLGSGLSVNTVKTARNRLKQAGLISFTEGKKGNPRDFGNKTVYEIRSSESDSQMDNHSDSHPDDTTKQATINSSPNNTSPSVHQKGKSNPGKNDRPVSVSPEKGKEKNCAKKERTAFTPPSVEMVTQFCKENEYTISAWKFVNYYTSNGWLVGRNRMKDWRAAVRTWQSKENENGNRQLSPTNTIGIPRLGNNSKASDAEDKRTELTNLKQIAGTILRSTIPQNRE